MPLAPSRSHPGPRRRRPCAAALAAIALGTAALAAPDVAAGQGMQARADSLLRAGRVAAAESLYYRGTTRRPRDPAARLALGRYLASRGALRVGAVLLEEARFFGADSLTVARELAPVYARLRDYAALAALPGSPLSAPERARAAWLRDNPPAVNGDDSVTVPFTPLSGGSTLGTFRALVGGDSATVAVDASVSGWVVDGAASSPAARGVRRFGGGAAAGRAVGVADVRVGGLALVHQPVRLPAGPPPAPGVPRVRVGLDALGALAPTFDAGAGVLTLRGSGRVRPPRTAAHLPALVASDGVYVPAGGGLVSLGSAAGRRAVPAARRWTYDGRRGEVVLER